MHHADPAQCMVQGKQTCLVPQPDPHLQFECAGALSQTRRRCLPTSRCAAPLPSSTFNLAKLFATKVPLLSLDLTSSIRLSHRLARPPIAVIDEQPMEVDAPVLAPQQAVTPPAAALAKKTLASDVTATPKSRVTRRKTLCDITNLSKRKPVDVPGEPACPEAPAPADAGGLEGFAQLVEASSPIRNPGFLIAGLACVWLTSLFFFLISRIRRKRNS